MIDAIGDLIEAGRVKVYAVDSYDSGSWYREGALARGARAAARPLRGLDRQPGRAVHPRRLGRTASRSPSRASASAPTTPPTSRSGTPISSRSRSARAASTTSPSSAGGERGDAVYFNNPADYVSHLGGDHLDWLRGQVNLLLICGPGLVGGLDGRAREHEALRRAARREGHPARARRLGIRRPARLARVARPDRASSPPLRTE